MSWRQKKSFGGEEIVTFTPKLLLQNGESDKFTLFKMPRMLIWTKPPHSWKWKWASGEIYPNRNQKHFWTKFGWVVWPFFQVTHFCFGGECLVFQGDFKILGDNSQKLAKSYLGFRVRVWLSTRIWGEFAPLITPNGMTISDCITA